jgi:hypothetical protein
VIDAKMRGHLTDQRVGELNVLVRRTSTPLARFLRYLRRSPDRF